MSVRSQIAAVPLQCSELVLRAITDHHGPIRGAAVGIALMLLGEARHENSMSPISAPEVGARRFPWRSTMTRPKLLPWLLTPSILTVSIGFAFYGAHAAEHTLMPSPQTVHFGYF